MTKPARFVLLVFLAAIILNYLTVRVDAAPNLYGDIGIAWRIPGAPITLIRVYSYLTTTSNYLNQVTPMWTNDCVMFANSSTRTVTSVQFAFALIDSQDRALGTPLLYDVREGIAPGVVKNELDTYCKSYGYGAGKDRHVVGWVNTVTFEDGSTWRAVPAVIGAAISKPGTPIHLTHVATYAPAEECADFVNTSERTVTHIQIVFRHSGPDDANLGDDALDVHADIAPGATVHNNCRGLKGVSKPDVSYYGYALSHGIANLKPPEIMYDGKPSTLSAWINEVDFSDGTTWHAPPT